MIWTEEVAPPKATGVRPVRWKDRWRWQCPGTTWERGGRGEPNTGSSGRDTIGNADLSCFHEAWGGGES